jgi:hypothetical protein
MTLIQQRIDRLQQKQQYQDETRLKVLPKAFKG